VILIVLPTLLWGKTFVENRSGDGTESFEFSRSLSSHQLPYWDLENGQYGFYPQFMLFAYPAELSFIVLGETEAAQRLPVFFYVFGIYLVLAELVRRRRRRLSALEVCLLVGAAAFFLLYHVHQSTYELVSDIAEPTGVDTFFTFLATAACYALVTKQRAWWGLFALFGSMALAAGLPFAGFLILGGLLAAWRFRSQAAFRGPALDALAFFVPWTAYQVFAAMYSRFHSLGPTKWDLSTLLELYPIGLDPGAALAILGRFLLVIAIVPVLGLWPGERRDTIARTVRWAVIGYLGVLLLFARTHPHYLIPLTLFPAALFLRRLGSARVSIRLRAAGHATYAVVLVALVIAALPSDRTPHTTYRQFGAETLMLYDSYPAVVAAAAMLLERNTALFLYLPDGKPLFSWERPRVIYYGQPPPDGPLQGEPLDAFVKRREAHSADLGPLGLSHHMWIRYSDRAPREGREYRQILAAAHLVPERIDGYARLDLPDGWVLHYRPESIFARLAPAGR
jgi:hypothetical protein